MLAKLAFNKKDLVLPVLARIIYGGTAYCLVPKFKVYSGASNVFHEKRTKVVYESPQLEEIRNIKTSTLHDYDWVDEREVTFINPDDNEGGISLLRVVEGEVNNSCLLNLKSLSNTRNTF